MSKDKLVNWGGDNTDDVSQTEIYEESDREYEREPFGKIYARAVAKRRNGERLTDKENWAIRMHAQNPGGQKRGPAPATRERLAKIAELQLCEGLSYSQMAEVLGIKFSTVAKTIQNWPLEHRKALEECENRLKKEAGTRRVVVGARILQKMAETALKSQEVIDELMEGAAQERVRLDAAIHSQKVFGVAGESNQFAPQSKSFQPLDEAAVKNLADSLGLLKVLPRIVPTDPGEVLDAEVVDVSV